MSMAHQNLIFASFNMSLHTSIRIYTHINTCSVVAKYFLHMVCNPFLCIYLWKSKGHKTCREREVWRRYIQIYVPIYLSLWTWENTDLLNNPKSILTLSLFVSPISVSPTPALVFGNLFLHCSKVGICFISFKNFFSIVLLLPFCYFRKIVLENFIMQVLWLKFV